MSKVYTKVIDDHADVTDPMDADHEYCLIAHVHLRARSVGHAMERIGNHFLAVEAEEKTDEHRTIFNAGHITLRRADAVHDQNGKERLN